MMFNRWAWAAIGLAIGALQAWDSGVLGATASIQALVGVALLLPAAAFLATESYGIRALAVAAAFALLTVARLTSSIPLPTLHIVAFIPAVLIFFSHLVDSRPEARAGSVKS